MDNIQTSKYEDIIKIIRNWPLSQRLTLVQDVLSTFVPELETDKLPPPRAKRNTLNNALGLLATNHSPPSDEEIQNWLDEYRLEKYG